MALRKITPLFSTALATFAVGICFSFLPWPIRSPKLRSDKGNFYSVNRGFGSKVRDGIGFVDVDEPPRNAQRYYLPSTTDVNFIEFHSLEISYSPGKNGIGMSEIVFANIDGSSVGLTYLWADPNEISFHTLPVNGISYFFIGKFRDRTDCGVKIDEPGIEGQLFKLEEGKVLTNAFVKFQRVWGC